jgi:hypothetical protein
MAFGLLVANQAIVAAMFDRCWDPSCRVFGNSFVREDKSISLYLPFVQPAAKADSEPIAAGLKSRPSLMQQIDCLGYALHRSKKSGR